MRRIMVHSGKNTNKRKANKVGKTSSIAILNSHQKTKKKTQNKLQALLQEIEKTPSDKRYQFLAALFAGMRLAVSLALDVPIKPSDNQNENDDWRCKNVHAYNCPFWRTGKKHGPCNCMKAEQQRAIGLRVGPRPK